MIDFPICFLSPLKKGDTAERPQRIKSLAVQALDLSFPLILFLLAFLPRAIHLVARATLWHYRTADFIQAVSQRDWAATMLTSHPGVTTMWLAGIALQLGSVFVPDLDQQPVNQQMTIELLPLVLVISLGVVLAYFMLSRLLDRQVAAVSMLMLALDPFHIHVSKTLHVDALMSVFAMLSALSMLMVVGQAGHGRWRYILLSGLFAGLALLSKTPALFLVPYFLLCLGASNLYEALKLGRRLRKWRDWLAPAGEAFGTVFLWTLALVVTFFLLYPAMWVQPGDSLSFSYGETWRYANNPHPNPILFMGEATLDDPGPLFYPVSFALKTTEITFPCFLLGIGFLFSRNLGRRQRLVLLLMVAFGFFFTVQMTLGQKKAFRYNLSTFQFIDMVAGLGLVYTLRCLTRGRRWLLNLALVLLVAAQFAISISRHPYYGTHYNRIFGSPKNILEKGIVAGQEQGEGLDIAAGYMNRLPMSPLLVVGSQIDQAFWRYFQGKTVRMTDEKVDYLVFARNYVVRGTDAREWESLWDRYRRREPKFLVSFDGVPYVWVYKVSPVIDESAIENPVFADVGKEFRLLGYDLEPAKARPGETIRITLYWEAVHKPAGDYTVFTHLIDPAGELRGQQDNQPQGGMYPTNLWDKGERVQDRYELTVAPDAPPGAYNVAVGMYDLATGQRLPITDSDYSLLPDARLLISGLEVLQPPE